MSTTTYTIDSVAFRVDSNSGKLLDSVNVYLGVYTGLDAAGTLSGFGGVSTSAITIVKNAGINYHTWTFSGNTVTPEASPGSGGDQRFFVFQTGTAALTTLPTLDIPLMRSGDSYSNRFSGVLRFDGLLVSNRSPDYTATITPVPEPSSTTFLGGLLGFALLLRRRK